MLDFSNKKISVFEKVEFTSSCFVIKKQWFVNGFKKIARVFGMSIWSSDPSLCHKTQWLFKCLKITNALWGSTPAECASPGEDFKRGLELQRFVAV